MKTDHAAPGADRPLGAFVEAPAVPSPVQAAIALRRARSAAHEHDIISTAEGTGRLGTFVDYMRAAGLSALLRGDGPFTVFAPTDKAFMKITLRGRDALLADPRRLRAVMRGHIVAGRIAAPSAGTSSIAITIEGTSLTVTSGDGTYLVGNARLVQTSIPASNGVIHAIDAVLLGA